MEDHAIETERERWMVKEGQRGGEGGGERGERERERGEGEGRERARERAREIGERSVADPGFS